MKICRLPAIHIPANICCLRVLFIVTFVSLYPWFHFCLFVSLYVQTFLSLFHIFIRQIDVKPGILLHNDDVYVNFFISKCLSCVFQYDEKESFHFKFIPNETVAICILSGKPYVFIIIKNTKSFVCNLPI